MKNQNTPRTLAECDFTTGYRSAQLGPEPAWEVVAGYALAIAIGIALACVLFFNI